jgi:hypothetical protein
VLERLFEGIPLILGGFGLQEKKMKVKNLSHVKKGLVSCFQIATKTLLKSLVMSLMKLQLGQSTQISNPGLKIINLLMLTGQQR